MSEIKDIPTPRTDKEVSNPTGLCEVVTADFARLLERELEIAKQQHAVTTDILVQTRRDVVSEMNTVDRLNGAAERWQKGCKIGFPRLRLPEHTGDTLHYWTNGTGKKYASAELAIDEMPEVLK